MKRIKEVREEKTIPERIEALSVAMKDIEKVLSRMGGSIVGDKICYSESRILRHHITLSFEVRFNPDLLGQYVDQAQKQDRGNP